MLVLLDAGYRWALMDNMVVLFCVRSLSPKNNIYFSIFQLKLTNTTTVSGYQDACLIYGISFMFKYRWQMLQCLLLMSQSSHTSYLPFPRRRYLLPLIMVKTACLATFLNTGCGEEVSHQQVRSCCWEEFDQAATFYSFLFTVVCMSTPRCNDGFGCFWSERFLLSSSPSCSQVLCQGPECVE